jgi:hypothetical protein
MVARYWVGGTGTWDVSDTTHWASASNGAGGQSVPTSVDAVTFDASSGGGIVTINGNHTVLSFDCGGFTGTIDWSINNNNFTSLGVNQFSGSGTRTIKLGSGTFYFDTVSLFTVTGLTWTPGTALVNCGHRGAPTTSYAIAISNGVTWPNMSIGPDVSWPLHTTSQSPLITNLDLVGPVKWRGLVTHTITNLTCSGYSKGQGAEIRGEGATMNFALTNPATLHWAALRGVNCTSAAIRAYNSLDGGGNTNVQISPPKRGRIIGG